MKIKRMHSEMLYQFVLGFIVILVAAVCLFPLLYVVGMSLSSYNEMISRNFFVLIPRAPTLSAYERLLVSPIIWKSMLISLYRSTVGPLLMLALTVLAGYVLAQKKIPGRKIFLLVILFPMLFSGGLIPNYYVIRRLGLIDNYLLYVITSMANSFAILIIKSHIEGLPAGVMEQAEIDGASPFKTLIRIVIPLCLPVLTALGMFALVDHWNSWFDAMVYMPDKGKHPLQMILRNMLMFTVSSYDQFIGNATMISPDTLKFATIVIGILPLLIIYPFLQKYFVKGVFMGSIKE